MAWQAGNGPSVAAVAPTQAQPAKAAAHYVHAQLGVLRVVVDVASAVKQEHAPRLVLQAGQVGSGQLGVRARALGGPGTPKP